MIDYNITAKALSTDTHMRDITPGRCIYLEIHSLFGADIKSHMPVIGPQFSKIGCKFHRNAQWVAEIVLRIGNRLSSSIPGKNKNKNDNEHSVPHIQNYNMYDSRSCCTLSEFSFNGACYFDPAEYWL